MSVPIVTNTEIKAAQQQQGQQAAMTYVTTGQMPQAPGRTHFVVDDTELDALIDWDDPVNG